MAFQNVFYYYPQIRDLIDTYIIRNVLKKIVSGTNP